MASDKPVMKTTKIADRDVPIEPGELIAIRFSGGRFGESEAGVYEFWTVFKVENGTVIKCTARCHQGSDPGERFRRMEGQKEYERAWKVASVATGIRPATQKAVIKWLTEHPNDACFAESCLVAGTNFKVVKTVDGYQIQ
jgi:hypothetical protein